MRLPSAPSQRAGPQPGAARRRITTGFITILLLFLASGSLVISRADGPQQIHVLRAHVFEFPSDNPCGGRPRKITVAYDATFTVASPAPTDETMVWAALVQTGAFEITAATPGQPTYRGTFQLMHGNPGERHSQPEALVLELVGRGTDGSAFATRLFEHITPDAHGFDIALTTSSLPLASLTCS
jgi:hypothetical protein